MTNKTVAINICRLQSVNLCLKKINHNLPGEQKHFNRFFNNRQVLSLYWYYKSMVINT
jgi:hypothetical protein